MASSSTATPLL
jgi:vesicle-associated membrane protein 7